MLDAAALYPDAPVRGGIVPPAHTGTEAAATPSTAMGALLAASAHGPAATALPSRYAVAAQRAQAHTSAAGGEPPRGYSGLMPPRHGDAAGHGGSGGAATTTASVYSEAAARVRTAAVATSPGDLHAATMLGVSMEEFAVMTPAQRMLATLRAPRMASEVVLHPESWATYELLAPTAVKSRMLNPAEDAERRRQEALRL